MLDCSNSNALEMELLQSCTKPMIYFMQYICVGGHWNEANFRKCLHLQNIYFSNTHALWCLASTEGILCDRKLWVTPQIGLAFTTCWQVWSIWISITINKTCETQITRVGMDTNLCFLVSFNNTKQWGEIPAHSRKLKIFNKWWAI